MPSPLAFQRSFGPSAGHFFSRPVSRQMPSRLGPRQAGQSSARRPGGVRTTRVKAKSRTNNRQQHIFIVASPTEKNMGGRSGPPARRPGRIMPRIVAHSHGAGNDGGGVSRLAVAGRAVRIAVPAPLAGVPPAARQHSAVCEPITPGSPHRRLPNGGEYPVLFCRRPLRPLSPPSAFGYDRQFVVDATFAAAATWAFSATLASPCSGTDVLKEFPDGKIRSPHTHQAL